MTPYWSSRDSRIVLHFGDLRDVLPSLPDKSIDVTACDPPYSDHVHAHGRKGTRRTTAGFGKGMIDVARDLGFAALSPELRKVAASHIARLTRRWALVFSDTESSHLWRDDLEHNGLDYVRTAFWHKVGGAPQFTGDRPAVACEAITICHPPGKKRWHGGGKQGLYQVPIVLERSGSVQDGEARIHTTQKPIKLCRSLLADFTDPGETVLDCFAGGATFLAAAYTLGRRCIGVELDEKNAEAAAKRLEALTAQGSLFGGAA